MVSDNPVQSEVNKLVAKVALGTIGRIEIVQIPATVLTRANVTPEMLEKQYHYKVIIRHVSDGVLGREIATALKSLKAYPETVVSDLRWGIIFFDEGGGRAGAIYFGARGSRGAVGGATASFSGSFFGWLSSNFSCFR
jgi:hypothetical protein